MVSRLELCIGVKGIKQEDLSTISEQDEVSIAENFIKYGKQVLYNLFLDIIYGRHNSRHNLFILKGRWRFWRKNILFLMEHS